MIRNDSSQDVTARWNPYLNTYMLDVRLNNKVETVGAIRDGVQHFKHGIKTVTKLMNECGRQPCDILSADIFISDS